MNLYNLKTATLRVIPITISERKEASMPTVAPNDKRFFPLLVSYLAQLGG